MELDPSGGYLKGVADLSRWRGIVVATTARWLWINERDYTADVCIADEAWQMTYADLGGLGPLSAQVVLVGDPGQIAPVVTGDSRRWQDWSAGPHRAAPEALMAAYPDSVTRLRLPHTWRLGPQTTALIQPAFYAELPFTSARPPRHIQLGETMLPELSVQLVSTLAGPGDPGLAAAAAARVRDCSAAPRVVDADGNERHLQATTLPSSRRMSSRRVPSPRGSPTCPGVLIGTANQVAGPRTRSGCRRTSARRLPRSSALRDRSRSIVRRPVPTPRARHRHRRHAHRNRPAAGPGGRTRRSDASRAASGPGRFARAALKHAPATVSRCFVCAAPFTSLRRVAQLSCSAVADSLHRDLPEQVGANAGLPALSWRRLRGHGNPPRAPTTSERSKRI